MITVELKIDETCTCNVTSTCNVDNRDRELEDLRKENADLNDQLDVREAISEAITETLRLYQNNNETLKATIAEARDVLYTGFDRNRDKDDSLRTLCVVAINALARAEDEIARLNKLIVQVKTVKTDAIGTHYIK